MSKYKLYGFSSPARVSPSFLTPIFESNGEFYVQKMDDKDHIKGFEKVSLDSLNSIQNDGDYCFEEGDDAIFGVSDEFSEVTYETKNRLKHYLRSKISNYIDTPFFYKEVSEFCEVVLPEFYGCKSNKDFLIRQVVSNLIPEFSEKNKLRIESSHIKPNKRTYELQLSELIHRVENPKSVLTSDHGSLLSTYESFFDFALNKHKKLYEHSSFLSSLESAVQVLSNIEDNDVYEIRNDLTYILDCNLGLECENKREKFKFKNTKIKRKHYTKMLEKWDKVECSSVNSEGLSFVIFVTSRFTQEAQRKRRSEEDILHITKR